jgi:hypothetical protein
MTGRRLLVLAPLTWRAIPRIVVVGIALGWGSAVVISDLPLWPHQYDLTRAYLPAAERLLSGHQLYPAVDPDSADAYRYAPWFAAAMVPLLIVPEPIIKVGWAAAMLAACLAVMWRLRGSWAGYGLMGLVGGYLLRSAAYGNVQPVIVLALLLMVERRSGPVWIGLATSLKAVPLLFVIVYLGRREWIRAAQAIAVAVLLAAPMLLFDLSHYPLDTGPGFTLLPLAPVAIVATVILARSRYRWTAAAVSVIACLPRLVVYDLGFLLVAIQSRQRLPTPTRGDR